MPDSVSCLPAPKLWALLSWRQDLENYRLLAAAFYRLLPVSSPMADTPLLPKHLQSSIIIMLITAQWKCLIYEHMISLTNEFTVTVVE